MAKREHSGSGFGGFLGVIVFLAGIGLLAFTFKLAYDMFGVPAEHALGLRTGQAFDVAQVTQSLTSIVMRVLLLIVMGIMGSLIANRGVSLFSGSKRSVDHSVGPNGTSV